MEVLAIFMIVLSPYTALLTGVFAGIKLIKSRADSKITSFKLEPTTKILILIGIIMAASGIYNKNTVSVLTAIPMFAIASINEFVVSTYTNAGKIKVLLSRIVLISLIAVAIGFIEKLLSFFVDMSFMQTLFWSASYVIDNQSYRIYSTFGNPNVAASWFSAVIIVSIYLSTVSGNDKKRFYYACIALFFVSIMFTGSRGGMIGLGAGIFVYALLKRDVKSIVFLALIVVLSALALLFLPEANRPLAGRTDIWHVCIQMIKEKPLLGNGVMGILGKTYEIHAHNVWISFLTMTGAIGFLSYIAYRFFILKSIISLIGKTGKKSSPYLNHGISVPLISIQSMIIVHGIVDFPFFVPQGAVIFFGSGALLIALDRHCKFNNEV